MTKRELKPYAGKCYYSDRENLYISIGKYKKYKSDGYVDINLLKKNIKTIQNYNGRFDSISAVEGYLIDTKEIKNYTVNDIIKEHSMVVLTLDKYMSNISIVSKIFNNEKRKKPNCVHELTDIFISNNRKKIIDNILNNEK